MRIRSKVFSGSRQTPVTTRPAINNQKLKNSWIDEDGILNVNCMNGNGDLWWVYNKLKSLNMKMKFHLCSYFPDNLQGYYENSKSRSVDLLDMLEIPYTIKDVTQEQMNSIIKSPFNKTMSKENILKEIQNGSTSSLCPNYYMEHGTHLNQVWPELELDYKILNLENHPNFNKEFVNKCDENTVFIHIATYGKDKGGWSDFNINTLLTLVKFLDTNGYNIGISGRDIDNVNWPQVIAKVKDITKKEPLVSKDEHISTCLEAVKRSKCIIGPINGFIIIALTQGVNTFALWPKCLEAMIPTILNPKRPCKYGHFTVIPGTMNSEEIINTDLINKIINWL
jgi:hypothetical protein